MKKIILFILFALTSFISLKAQTFEWSKHIKSCGDDIINDIATDQEGNVYALSGSDILNNPNNGITVNFGTSTLFTEYVSLSKYSSNGDLLWAIDPGLGTSIQIDSLGFIYLAGYDLAKYDSNGNNIWSKTVNAPIEGLGIDQWGNVYVSGSTSTTLIFGSDTLEGSLYSISPFIAKFDNNGNPLWLRRVIPHVGTAKRISTDKDGYSYITGWFNGHIPRYGASSLVTNGTWEAYIAKYDPLGNLVWIRQTINTPSDEVGQDIVLDGNGNCYFTGHSGNNTVFTSTSGSETLQNRGVFVVKYDSDGELQWLTSNTGYLRVDAIAANDEGECFVTGMFIGQGVFGDYTLTNNSGNGDMYVVCYNSNGSLKWLQQSTTPVETYNSNAGFAIAPDNNGNCYIGTLLHANGSFGSDTFTSQNVCNGTMITSDIVLSKITTASLAISAQFKNERIEIFPNPSTGIVNIKYDKTNNLFVTVKTLEGKIIHAQTLKFSASETISIDLAKLTKGIYIIEAVSFTGSTSQRKIVLQ